MYKDRLQLVTFEQAKRLKALGFDWETQMKYGNDDFAHSWRYSLMPIGMMGSPATKEEFRAPTVVLALKWFRDEKEINNGVGRYSNGFYYGWFFIKSTGLRHRAVGKDIYEAAESLLLNKLLTFLEIGR